ncbi:Ppx/GppA family phosphatase [Nitriliruptoraceae bacterium ZYF776]|nr:Ppx/GppA family phosphatase [Profundirhabdus halotolerans]
MRCSVLDLGSNSFHVLVADLDGVSLAPVEREREMLHLGRVVARHGHVPDAEVARATATVAHLSELARRTGTEEHLAVATAALRDAANGEAVIAALSEAAGTPVRVLPGEEEARLAYLGVRASVAIAGGPVLVLDLGGGSLELAAGAGADVAWGASVPLGVSRLSARVDHDPPRGREVRDLHDEVDRQLAPHLAAVRDLAPTATVAVGGTVRALARVVAARDHRWLPASINQLTLTTDELLAVRDELVTLDAEGRLRVPGMKRRRVDHLHLAAVVLGRALEILDLDHVVISDWGLREGLLLDAHGVAAPPGPRELRSAEVARLRATFVTDPDHLDHVARLADRLFEELAAMHGLGVGDRELLAHAARLHDVGETLALRRHHLHGAYLVTNAELRGFSPDEVALLSTLVRYHRSRGIDRDHPPFAALPAALRDRARRLLPLLHLAVQLDRTRDRSVDDVAVEHVDGDVHVRTLGDGVPLALLDEERVVRLFDDAYGVTLTLAAGTRVAG